MAKVEMDLQELKAIENAVETHKKSVNDLQIIINEKDKEIATIKADKRTVKVTTKLKPRYSDDYNIQFKPSPIHEQGQVSHRLASDIVRYIKEYEQRVKYSHTRDPFELEKRIHGFTFDALNKLLMSKSNYENLVETTETEYINFEDVKIEISAKLEANVTAEISRYKKEITLLNDTLTNHNIASDKKLKDISERYQAQIDELVKDADKKYTALSIRYDDLLANRETKSLEQQIFDLQEELKAEKAKKWYQKLRK